MTLLLATFGLCVVSALFPLVNAEAYMVAVAATATGPNLWLLACSAAAGQMLGKAAWYELGRRSLHWSWVERKMATPKRQRQLAVWQERVHGRPFYAGLALFASAFIGLPPFLVISVLAGQLRMSFLVFLLTGLVGRFARFALILHGVSVLA